MKRLILCCIVMANLVALLMCSSLQSRAADLSSSYSWNPVRIGAGGFVVGFITHPLDANVRYCRTDVGNAYRWDNSKGEWVPMVVSVGGNGFPTSVASAPAQIGVESIALDPQNTNIVYLSLTTYHSGDVASLYPNVTGNVFKSVDGGQHFTAGNLSVALTPGSNYRAGGERMIVDPHNSSVLYYGTSSNGLYRSTNGGIDWSPVSSSTGAPPSNANVLGVRISPVDGSIYAIVLSGSVYRSGDGGQSWTNISAGQGIDGQPYFPVMASDGSLYVTQIYSQNVWRYKNGGWTKLTMNLGGGNLNGIAVDPNNANRIYAIGEGGNLARSLDGGANWTALGGYNYANNLGWLPQQIQGYRSNGGIFFDKNSKLWSPQGNEGVLSTIPNDTETAANPPKWTIESQGIEEFVTHDVVVPPGGKPIVAVEDATGFVINDPAQFTAKQIPLQDQLISNGTGLSYCPNAPSCIAVASADVNRTHSGLNYSGYSTDGGNTWQKFASYPWNPEAGITINEAGTIAVSARNGWGNGSDHLVWLPTGNYSPYYSTDGGAHWARTAKFPVDGNGKINGYTAYWNFSLKQRQLVADPFVADKFYLNMVWDGFYISTDGGHDWTKQTNAGLPSSTHHGQIAVNNAVQNDLWFVDGWEGASAHGLWHATDGGVTFNKLPNIDYSITLCLGKGSGNAGDASYSVYFYGKMSGDSNWGIFRSTDGGNTWNRISYYPTGIFDQPTCMAASWDSFSTVYVGFGGNSFVYGTTSSTGTTPTGSGSITRDVWTGIGGTSVSQIPVTTTPSSTGTLTSFEAPTNVDDNYGQRVRGTITAPTTGSYTFWIASDDNGELWLSPNDQASGKVKIAQVLTWTNSREWTREAGQKSAPVNLVAGQKYYVEALMKEGGGGDNLAVGWAKPGQSTGAPSEIVPGSALSPYSATSGAQGVQGAPIGHRIGLKANINGYYVSSDQNDSTYLKAAFAQSIGTWEQFDVVDAGNSKIALKCVQTGKYVTVDLRQSSALLRADLATSIGSWEPLTWENAKRWKRGLQFECCW